MRRAPAAFALALAALVAAPAAFGASGSLNDPDDDTLADVLRLSYANKEDKVVVRMSYDDVPATGRELLREVGAPRAATTSSSAAPTAPRSGTPTGRRSPRRAVPAIGCGTTRDSSVSTGTVPRSCMPRAPGRLKFQGIVTEGLFDFDETRTSSRVARG